jgi:hypothetical protein
MAISKRITAGLRLIPAVFLALGCDAGGAEVEEELFYAGEAQCAETSIDSPTDRPCHEDCTRACGYDGTPHYTPTRAVKYCVCQGGVFIECRCPRPDWYKGAIFAPYCDKYTAEIDGSGEAEVLDERPCEKEWDQCIGRDSVDGYTPRGAVCMYDDEGDLIWFAGSTEKWFAPEQSVRP